MRRSIRRRAVTMAVSCGASAAAYTQNAGSREVAVGFVRPRGKMEDHRRSAPRSDGGNRKLRSRRHITRCQGAVDRG